MSPDDENVVTFERLQGWAPSSALYQLAPNKTFDQINIWKYLHLPWPLNKLIFGNICAKHWTSSSEYLTCILPHTCRVLSFATGVGKVDWIRGGLWFRFCKITKIFSTIACRLFEKGFRNKQECCRVRVQIFSTCSLSCPSCSSWAATEAPPPPPSPTPPCPWSLYGPRGPQPSYPCCQTSTLSPPSSNFAINPLEKTTTTIYRPNKMTQWLWNCQMCWKPSVGKLVVNRNFTNCYVLTSRGVNCLKSGDDQLACVDDHPTNQHDRLTTGLGGKQD